MSKICFCIVVTVLSGCTFAAQGPISERESARGTRARLSPDPLRPPSIPALASGAESPPDPEMLHQTFSAAFDRWLYGPGLGRTMLNVGTVVVFPPYALYLLGNAGLALAGCEPLYITDAIPEGPRRSVMEAYETVTDVPGQAASTVAGRAFNGEEPR